MIFLEYRPMSNAFLDIHLKWTRGVRRTVPEGYGIGDPSGTVCLLSANSSFFYLLWE